MKSPQSPSSALRIFFFVTAFCVLATEAVMLAHEPAETPRTWTDNQGRQVRAALVEIDARSIRLKKVDDGKTYIVPLEVLSAADRAYVTSLLSEKRSTDDAPRSNTENTQPTDWHESLREDVQKAARLRSADGASSLLLFKRVLEREKDGPTATQKAWLNAQIKELQPTVLTSLRQDYKTAAEKSNLLDMLIVQAVANKIAEGSIDTTDKMPVIKNRVFTGLGDVTYIWQIANPVIDRLGSSYDEGFGFNRVTLTSKKGFHFVRVKAQVRNVFAGRDASYTLWAFEDIETILTPIHHNPEELPEFYRWLDDTFIYLLTPANDLISCSHVVEGCSLRRGSVSISSSDGSGRIIALPQPVKNGDTTNIDLVFAVPEEIMNYRLFIFGGAPVPFKNQ